MVQFPMETNIIFVKVNNKTLSADDDYDDDFDDDDQPENIRGKFSDIDGKAGAFAFIFSTRFMSFLLRCLRRRLYQILRAFCRISAIHPGLPDASAGGEI